MKLWIVTLTHMLYSDCSIWVTSPSTNNVLCTALCLAWGWSIALAAPGNKRNRLCQTGPASDTKGSTQGASLCVMAVCLFLCHKASSQFTEAWRKTSLLLSYRSAVSHAMEQLKPAPFLESLFFWLLWEHVVGGCGPGWQNPWDQLSCCPPVFQQAVSSQRPVPGVLDFNLETFAVASKSS